MLIITAVITVAADNSESYISHAVRLAKDSVAKEPGCIQYLVHHNIIHRGMILLYEVYQDEQAHLDHLSTEHFQQFQIKTAELVESKMAEKWCRERYMNSETSKQ